MNRRKLISLIPVGLLASLFPSFQKNKEKMHGHFCFNCGKNWEHDIKNCFWKSEMNFPVELACSNCSDKLGLLKKIPNV